MHDRRWQIETFFKELKSATDKAARFWQITCGGCQAVHQHGEENDLRQMADWLRTATGRRS